MKHIDLWGWFEREEIDSRLSGNHKKQEMFMNARRAWSYRRTLLCCRPYSGASVQRLSAISRNLFFATLFNKARGNSSTIRT